MDDLNRINNFNTFLNEVEVELYNKKKSTVDPYEQSNCDYITTSIRLLRQFLLFTYIRPIKKLGAGESMLINYGEFYLELQNRMETEVKLEKTEVNPYEKWKNQEAIKVLERVFRKYVEDFINKEAPNESKF